MSAVRALEELREGFVATVSHELRTPLALIRGYAETLLHLDLDPGAAARVRRTHRRGDRAVSRRSSTRSSTSPISRPTRSSSSGRRRRSRRSSRGCAATSRSSGGADRLVESAPADLPPVDVDVGAGRPGPREPRRQRAQVRAGRLAGRHRRRGRRSVARPVASTTKASASPRMIARWSPSRSTEPGTSASRGSPARVSACSSAAAWSRPTAGACRSATGSMAAREHG